MVWPDSTFFMHELAVGQPKLVLPVRQLGTDLLASLRGFNTQDPMGTAYQGSREQVPTLIHASTYVTLFINKQILVLIMFYL